MEQPHEQRARLICCSRHQVVWPLPLVMTSQLVTGVRPARLGRAAVTTTIMIKPWKHDRSKEAGCANANGAFSSIKNNKQIVLT